MGIIVQIAEAWWTYLFKSLPPEAKAKAKQCKSCENKVKGTFEELMPDYSLKEVQGYKCKICKCPLSTVLRSDKECPIGKF